LNIFKIFLHYLKDKDGALKDDELEHLFSTAPENPWLNTEFPHTTITNEAGAVTLQGWLAQWRCVSFITYFIFDYLIPSVMPISSA